MIQRCWFMTSVDQLPSPERLRGLHRLYFGSEFCELRLPTLDGLSRVVEQGLPVSLVTAQLTSLGLRRVDRLLESVSERGWNLEVVFNDFGMLERFGKHPGIQLVAGRLVTRNILDIAKDRLQITYPPMFEYMLKHFRVSRYEMTNYRTPLLPPFTPLPSTVTLSLYHPYMYLTTTRECIFRFRETAPNTPPEGVGCSQPCTGQKFRLQYPGHVEETLYLKGNTMFSAHGKFEIPPRDLAAMHCDRVVQFADLPV